MNYRSCETMIRAFLFDMDGVLVDSMSAHFYAFNATIRKFGKESVSMKMFNEELWGRYIAENIKEIFGNIPGEKLREIVEEYPLQVGKYAEHMKLYGDAKEVLEELGKKGVKLGLITSSQKGIVEPLITRLSLKNYFAVVVCGDQIKRPKPAPDGIIKACQTLEIRPNEAVFVGDNHQDVEAGKSAGCFTVGITTTSSREELKDSDAIIDNLTQLLNYTS